MIKVEKAWLRFIEVVSVNSLVKGRITNYFAINKDLEIWILDKDENLLCSGLQKHWNCHSNEMKSLPILLAAVFLGTGNSSSKIVYGSSFLQ